MRDRRALLRGLAALPLATIPVVALPSLASSTAPEPIVAVLDHARALHDEVDRPGIPEERSDAAYDEMAELRDAAAGMCITTMAGAVAALTWARTEFASYHLDKDIPDHLDVVTLGFIDGALGVMRTAVEGGRA